MLQKISKVILGMLVIVLCFIGIGIKNSSYELISYAATSDWYTHWAHVEIESAMNKGWVNGSEIFRPNDSITRAEFVKVFNRVFGLTTSSGKVFSDTNTHWAKDEIDIAVTNGVCNGKSATEFYPNDPITREEAAVMISNYKKIADENLDKLSKYTDANQVSSWAKNSVEGVIEKGYMGAGGIIFLPKTTITRAETVVALGRVISNTPITPGGPWPEVIAGDESQNNVSSSQYFTKEGDWIYYYNYLEQTVYKIKTDGSNKTKLVQTGSTNGSHIAVKDGYLYYTVDNGRTHGEIWKIKIDGSNKKEITSGYPNWFGNLYFYKDKIYFNTSFHAMYSSNLDGSTSDLIGVHPTDCGLWGNKIYYTKYSENDNIYERNLDTNETTKINDTSSFDINVYGEYIYFINRDDNNKIYRTKIGGNAEKISDETTKTIHVDNGWIYYRDEADDRKLYKMKIDGTNKTKLSDDSVGDIYIVGDWVVYAKFGLTEYVAIKKDGSLKYQL